MSNHHARGAEVSPQNDFIKRTHRAGFSFRIGEQVPDFWRCLTLDVLQKQLFARKLRRHHQNGPLACAGRMLAVTSDETSFHVLVLLSVHIEVLGADIPK